MSLEVRLEALDVLVGAELADILSLGTLSLDTGDTGLGRFEELHLGHILGVDHDGFALSLVNLKPLSIVLFGALLRALGGLLRFARALGGFASLARTLSRTARWLAAESTPGGRLFDIDHASARASLARDTKLARALTRALLRALLRALARDPTRALGVFAAESTPLR